MTQRIAILDKDGTLTRPRSVAKFVSAPDDQELLPGVAERVAELKAMGFVLAIASNQGGVAAGHKSLDDTISEMAYLLQLLPQVSDVLFCPEFDGLECWRVWGDCSEACRMKYENEIVLTPCGGSDAMSFEYMDGASPAKNFRKPGPGMLNLAMEIHGSSDAVYIGDRSEDEKAAIAANIPFVDADDWRTGRVVLGPNCFIV